MFDDDPVSSEESERRQAPRIGIEAEVLIHGDEAWAGTYQTGDLSTSGAFLVTDAPPPRGAMVRLDLNLEPGVTVRDVQALVVHVRTDASVPSARGCGLMFLRIARDEAKILDALVASRMETSE